MVPGHVFAAGDVLHVIGAEQAIERVRELFSLASVECPPGFPLASEESLAEVVLPRRSQLVGRTLRECKLRDAHRVSALALRRRDGTIVRDPLALRDTKLRVGDTLLVKGRLKYLRSLRSERADLVLVAEPDLRPGVLADRRGAALARRLARSTVRGIQSLATMK